MQSKAATQYLQTQVLTASREKLVLMLYDGVIRSCGEARNGWEENQLEAAHKALIKAQNIILELFHALDREQGGEIATKLSALYAYCYRLLVDANLERSAVKVEEVQSLIRNLREGWAEAMGQMAEASTESVEESVEIGQGDAPAARPAAPAKEVAVPLARVPVAKVPAAQAKAGTPRLSVQG